MAFCLITSMNVFAETYVTVGDLVYQLNGTEAYVDGYVGTPTDVVIPATIESDGLTFKVTKVNGGAFWKKYTTTTSYSNIYCTSMTTIRAEGSNLAAIGSTTGSYTLYGAFEGCTSLVSVFFPYVKAIERWSFKDCSKLQHVWFGYNLTSLEQAFVNCTMLSYIVFPASFTQISSYEFKGCSRLQAIIYLGNQTSKGSSNADVYNVNNMVNWNENTFNYTGAAPVPTFTNNLPAGFQPTGEAALPTLQKDAGSYNTSIPISFANNDMSFTVDIPYSYTINPLTVTARVENTSKVYGDPNPQFHTDYSGFITGENESVITNPGTYSTTATTASTVGTYNVTQSGVKAKNYVFQYEPGTLTVTKAPLTVTARNKTMNYGGSVPTLEVDYQGLKNNESTPTWTTAPTITTTATSTSNAGTYPITVSGGVAQNYNVTFKQGTLTVNKVPLTATTLDATRAYGDENIDFELSYSGLKNGETAPEWIVEPTFTTPATATSPVGIYSISASGGEARNYLLQYVNTGQLTVAKAPLTATARSMTKRQGEANPTFIIDYEGFKNNETALALTQEPIATTTATLNSRPGTYPITVSDGVAMNYEFIYVNGTLTVLPVDEPGNPADNMLEMSSLKATKNTQVILPIALKNEKEITGLQFDLYLPDGVTVATNSKGKMIISTTDRMEGNYSISSSTIDNFVRVAGYSGDGDAFTGTEGDILNVTLNIAEDMDDGDYTIRIKDIVLSDVNNKEYHPADVGATLTVKSFVLGDVDNSGAININDVVCIINHILNRPVASFIEGAADVDESGTININDVVTLINRYILHRTTSRADVQSVMKAPNMDENYLHIDAIEIAPGETKTVQVLMTNANTVTAVEGNIKLPAGISFVTNAKGKPVVEGNEERAEDYNLSCEIQSDGSMTFAQYSDDGYDYEGNSGHIFTFTITADANATPGTYDVLLSGVVLSIGGTGYEIPNRNSSLTVTSGETIYTILDETSTAVPEATTTAVDIKVLRTIKTNEWNTICLPFAMTGAQVTTAFGSDVQLADFIDYDVNDDATLLTVNFNMINPTDGMEANYPYLIKISKPQNMTEFTAKAVIEPAEDDAVVEYDNGKSGSRRQVYGTFKGTYHAQTVVPENSLFISEDKFWYSTGATKMKAYRAYFDFVDILSAVENPSSRIVMSFDDDTTGISNTNSTNDTNEWYTVSGVKVEKPVRKGLYIQNGKKKVVK